MDIDKFDSVYFVGIGGIGMSAIARYFNMLGKHVSGYDKIATPLTKELEEEGINIHYTDSVNLIPDQIKISRKESLIVYTPAIPGNHSELQFFREQDYIMMKRSEVLGLITHERFTIAVAGTHGKTTTSTLIAHLLKDAGTDPTAFLGGISTNYNTNFIAGSTDSIYVVVEADEFDRSFLQLHPDVAVITSMDPDHLDIYGDPHSVVEGYNLFAKRIKSSGTLIHKKGLPVEYKNITEVYSYSISDQADFQAVNIRVENGSFVFDLITPEGKEEDLHLGLPGFHNIENAVAAYAVARLSGITPGSLRNSMASFSGVKRRFEYVIRKENFVFIDDYAHHPEELRACISSVRELYPGKKITGIFQPHLYSRTRDFAEGFAESLSMLDELILLEIYPARELPITGVNSKMILDMVKLKNKTLCTLEELMDIMKTRRPEVLLTIGAGDIDQLVEPLKRYFSGYEK
jgi:UDP-N-acetylmuramate--alanine ligase